MGACSAEVIATTDNVPQRLNTPTSTNVDFNSIGLTWAPITADADTGGDPIVYYLVEFYN